VIRLAGLTVRFGQTTALAGVDLEVGGGEIVALLGPSGAGKTTLLRAVAGLERPAAGRLSIGGRDVRDAPAGARDVAMQFEHYGLYPQWSVFENIAFPLRAPVRRAEWPEPSVDSAVRRAAGLLEIGHLLERLPRQLSGGQRQRVSLARALVRRPAAMLLDEPIAHLDAKLRHLLRAALKRHLKTEGITTLWATPDQLEAVAVADRIALLDGGRLAGCGTPASLYRRPRTLAEARALGDPSINEIDAELTSEGGRLVVRWDGEGRAVSWPLPGAVAAGLPAGAGRVRLGVRPAAVALGGPPGGDRVPGRIELVEPLGASTIVTVALGGARVRAKRPGREGWLAGQAVAVGFEADGVHLFDPTTGTALA
jgi:multiple sugar transport system ATP-binding protein